MTEFLENPDVVRNDRAIWSLVRFLLWFPEDADSAKHISVLFTFQRRVHVPFAVMARGVVLAAQALARHRVAVIGVAVALAGLAAREAPVPGQAPVTLPRVHPLEAVALASDGVAESTDRPLQVAVARWRDTQAGSHPEKLIACQHTPHVSSRGCPRAPGTDSQREAVPPRRGQPRQGLPGHLDEHLTVRLTYVCSHWGQSRRFQEHICRRFFQPRSAGTGTGPRWGRRRSLRSPAGRTHRLQGKRGHRLGHSSGSSHKGGRLVTPQLRPGLSLPGALSGPSSLTPWADSEFPHKPISSL